MPSVNKCQIDRIKVDQLRTFSSLTFLLYKISILNLLHCVCLEKSFNLIYNVGIDEIFQFELISLLIV